MAELIPTCSRLFKPIPTYSNQFVFFMDEIKDGLSACLGKDFPALHDVGRFPLTQTLSIGRDDSVGRSKNTGGRRVIERGFSSP